MSAEHYTENDIHRAPHPTLALARFVSVRSGHTFESVLGRNGKVYIYSRSNSRIFEVNTPTPHQHRVVYSIIIFRIALHVMYFFSGEQLQYERATCESAAQSEMRDRSAAGTLLRRWHHRTTPRPYSAAPVFPSWRSRAKSVSPACPISRASRSQNNQGRRGTESHAALQTRSSRAPSWASRHQDRREWTRSLRIPS